jgi:hypothetical protein
MAHAADGASLRPAARSRLARAGQAVGSDKRLKKAASAVGW